MSYVTEDEATGKSCARDPWQVLCQGARCMAWRWGPRDRFDYTNGDVSATPEGPHKIPPGTGWVKHEGVLHAHGQGYYQVWRRDVNGRQGFCGLAGAP